MSLKQVSNNTEIDERLAALMTNTNAIKAIASAVEGTIGPKGLDTMLVDKFGDVVITNDGVTILNLMEVNHPAARMLINTARAQQEEIGDGTTTATIMVGILVSTGLEQVVKGVPVARVVEGMRAGVWSALDYFRKSARPVRDFSDPILRQVALIAGRDHEDIADLAVEAARLTGKEKLLDPFFRLSNSIKAQVGADNAVFGGTLINKERLNREMPREILDARILVVDDALEPEALEDEALGTESGFQRFLALREQFRENIHNIIRMGVNVVLVDRGIDDEAEEMFTDAGVLVVQRVAHLELVRAAEHVGAKLIKRTGLKRGPAELERYLGRARCVKANEKLEHVLIFDGAGTPTATILVGAATEEVVGERERIAKDAAASVQASIRGGVVPGGGSIELAASREVERARGEVRGMAAYGVDCVVAALRRPFTQIILNAGFNPLEKLGDVLSAQCEGNSYSLAIDCNEGAIADMFQLGVVDPVLVKIHALKAAAEVAEAILRIDTIIKKKDDGAVSRSEAMTGLER